MTYYIFKKNSSTPLGKFDTLDRARAKIFKLYWNEDFDYLTTFQIRTGSTIKGKLVGSLSFDIGRHEVFWNVGKRYYCVQHDGRITPFDMY